MINMVLLGLEKIPELKLKSESIITVKSSNRKIEFSKTFEQSRGRSSISCIFTKNPTGFHKGRR